MRYRSPAFAGMLGAACLLPLAGHQAMAADAYPVRPVRILVGFSPGGGTDLLARMMAAKLGEQFKQSFLVENRVGASGNIAGQAVATAKPDGYLLLWIPTAHAVNAAIGKALDAGRVTADLKPKGKPCTTEEVGAAVSEAL